MDSDDTVQRNSDMLALAERHAAPQGLQPVTGLQHAATVLCRSSPKQRFGDVGPVPTVSQQALGMGVWRRHQICFLGLRRVLTSEARSR